jgi:hypothetical protein
MATHLPLPKQIRDLFTELLDREITLTPATPQAPGPQTPTTIAIYIDDAVRIRAVMILDLELSAYAAAAIGLVPAAAADAAIDEGTLTPVMRENLFEVLNIAASMFNAPGADHLRIHEVHPAGEALAPQVRALALTLGQREDFHLDIAGYGAGHVSVVLVG